MKLVIKADDGKEIVYLSGDDYGVGYIEEVENALIVDISKIAQRYKDYLENIKEDDIEMKKTGKEFILITPDIYFMFDEGLYDIVYEELDENNQFILAIGYGREINSKHKWISFFTMGMKKHEN